MRTALLLTLTALVACSGSKDTAPTDTSSSSDTSSTDTDPTSAGAHPLVPDEFQYLWDTDGCTTYDGEAGSNVYWYAQGSSDEAGNLVMTEQWFWFLGRGDVEQDCVDTFEIVGEYDAFDYTQLNCEPCEEGYRVTRTLVDSTCFVDYNLVFGSFDEPGEAPYVSIEMFDTLNAWGKPNWDNVMDTTHADPSPPGQESYWLVSLNWARGHAFPYGDYGYPSDYDWVGETCSWY